jgi:hypothetical protein
MMMHGLANPKKTTLNICPAGIVILKWILRKQKGRTYYGFHWLKIRSDIWL